MARRNGDTKMSKLTDAITQTAQSILPADATATDVFNAINVAISYHAASTLVDDAQFSKIAGALGRSVEDYDENDINNFTTEQTDAAVRALTSSRR
jgi:hypothetical protein